MKFFLTLPLHFKLEVGYGLGSTEKLILDILIPYFRLLLVSFNVCPSGGIGRHACLRGMWEFPVWVQIPPWAHLSTENQVTQDVTFLLYRSDLHFIAFRLIPGSARAERDAYFYRKQF